MNPTQGKLGAWPAATIFARAACTQRLGERSQSRRFKSVYRTPKGTPMLQMRAAMAVGLCLLASSGAATAQRGRRERGDDRVAVEKGWRFDYEAAKEEARREDKPMMVVFRCVP